MTLSFSSRPPASSAPAPDPDLSGFLLVDKPPAHTSHDVVARVRGRFRLRKVGHGGTLDPMATGLLVILVGKATKFSDRVMGHDKTYEAVMRLGVSTDSQDADGEITATRDPSAVTADALRAQFAARLGDQLQTPPMVSARKINGVPLYKLARKGQEIERPPKLIHVYSFDLLSYTPPDAAFRVSCTKGTYVRTLAHDVGEALGCGAHLVALRRTVIGSFTLDQAHPLDQILAAPSLAPFLLPLTALPLFASPG